MCSRKRCLYLFVNFDVLLFMKMRSLPVTFVTFVVALSAHAQTLRFEEHTIAADLKGGYQVIAYDINHDGKPDLVALASGMTELVWFENPGWQRHVIASNLPHMINCALWDIDGDGIPEIVVAYEFSMDASKSAGVIALLEHQGDPRQPWKVTEIDRLPTSHRLRWANIDGSGKKVVIDAPLTDAHARAPEFRGHVPLVYYRPGEWKRHLISDEEEGVVHGIFVTDYPPVRAQQGRGMVAHRDCERRSRAVAEEWIERRGRWAMEQGAVHRRHRALARQPGGRLPQERKELESHGY